MKRLQAAMRDSSARKSREFRAYFKVGSVMKGCAQCGEWFIDVSKGGKKWKHWTSGYDVFRSYQPQFAGWTYKCHTCGAKDAACWENAWDLGQEAIRGVRCNIYNPKDMDEFLSGNPHFSLDAVRDRKVELRDKLEQALMDPGEEARKEKLAKLRAEVARREEIQRLEAEIARLQEIARLEAEIAKLREQLKKGSE